MRAKFVQESISFQRGENPKKVLGIGGFDPKKEWENLKDIMKINYTFTKQKDNDILLKAWKELLEDTFIDRKVSGIMAVGNYDSWGSFHQMETGSQIERIELEEPAPYFALVTIEPGHFVKNTYGDEDEVWYRIRVNGEPENKLYIL